MTKVLHVIQSLDNSLGGLQSALKGILAIEDLIHVDHSVLTINSSYSKEEYLDTIVYSFESSFPRRFSNSRIAEKWLLDNIKKYSLLVIHSTWIVLNLKSCIVAKRKRIPYIIWPHGSLDPFDLQKKIYFKKMAGKLFVRNILSNASEICCTSEEEAKKIETFGANVRKTVLHLPINIRNECGSREQFRKKYKLNTSDFVLLFLSRINYKKGLEIILPSVGILRARGIYVKLIIAGTGDKKYLQEIKNIVRTNSLEDLVIFTGHLGDIEKCDAFAGSDLFVLPSLNENFGLSIFESLQLGLPVLVSDNVYLWNEIQANKVGWICNYSVKSFTDSIIDIIMNKDDYYFKKVNTTYFYKKFTPQYLSNNYKTLYEKYFEIAQ